MRSATKTLPWLYGFLVPLVVLPAPGLAENQVPAAASAEPVPNTRFGQPVALQDRLSEEATPDALAQAKQPLAGAAPSAPQTTTPESTAPAIAPTPAAGPVETASKSIVQTNVAERSFTNDLIVLPVDHLLGDWWGLRTRLEDSGINASVTLVSDMLGNPVGGMRHGFTEADNTGLNLEFDLDKICGIKGGHFFFSMSQRSGANLSAIDIGNTFTTQQVYGRETWQVINVDYRQSLLDDRVWFRLGRIAVGDVMDVSPYDYVFVQNAIDGNPVGIFFNAPGMTAYPNDTWGAELKVRPTERTYVIGGVYNGDIEHTHRLENHGLDWSMRGPVFLISEAVYQTNQLKDDTGLPGNYKLGIWYDGHSYLDFGTRVLGPLVPGLVPHVEHGNYGFYGMFDQVVIRFGEPGEKILRGVGLTACVQAAPDQSISQLPLFFEAGILVRGIFPQRPRDVAAFGIFYGQFSTNLRSFERIAQQQNPTVGVQDQETVLEWTYVFRFRNGAFFFQPDLQYIIRPGGTGNIPNALVVGCQTGINF